MTADRLGAIPNMASNPAENPQTKGFSVNPDRYGLPDLKAIFDLVRDEFDAANDLIPKQLTSPVPMVEAIGHHIVESGGKRLRPLIVLLAARACGSNQLASPTAETTNDPIRLAVIIEFLHTAMLLHDDVVDSSSMRRGKATANALWGNSPSILVGDFLYSRAFQLMVELDSMDVMSIISDASNVIAEGEVMQLANIGNHCVTEDDYREIIRRKTAMLFQAAAHTGAVIATDNANHIDALRRYGLHFGVAYQLVDDWLDYAGDAEVMGKNVGDDLAEGKMTLPLIQTLKTGTAAHRDLIRTAIANKSDEQLDDVIDAVRASGALDYTREKAIEEADRAAEEALSLPASGYRDALEALTQIAVGRLA